MAETDKDQKTEEATPKKREKAREDGRVALSHDLVIGAALAGSALLFRLNGGALVDLLAGRTQDLVSALAAPHRADPLELARRTLLDGLQALLPLFLLLLPVAAAASLAQIGLHFVPQKLRARPEKLAPQLTLDKFVNAKSMVETATSVLKLVALCGAAVMALWTDAPRLLALDDPRSAAVAGASLLVSLLLHLGFAMIAIGLLDLLFKKQQLDRDLRMTKEEVKQEAKDAQGDPEVRGRIRRRQREMAARRMMDQVPEASVVVTNPTHYAVALRYEQGQAAPRVVAKGMDFIALRIREVAKAAGVPVVENPPLARALHAAAEIGDEIPPALYQAVAEVLAAILRTRKRAGRSA